MSASFLARKPMPDYEIYKTYVFEPAIIMLCPPADAKGPVLSEMDIHCKGDALW